MKKFFTRTRNIGCYANGRKFLRDLYVFIICWRKGFYLSYWDGRMGQDYQSDAQRVGLNHDGKVRIIDVDILIDRGEKTLYVAGMQDDPDDKGRCGIANKRWKT